MKTLVTLRWALLLSGIVLAGCGGGNVPVEGTVNLNGQPLTSGSVAFHPEGSEDKSDAVVGRSEIDSSGKYKLMTNGQAGAPSGKYKVVVIASAPSDAKDPYSLPKSLVNEKFTQPATTPLTVEVASGNSPDKYKLEVAP